MKLVKFVKKVISWSKEKFETKIISKLFLFSKVENIILFESVPDLSDSTKPVFDEMLKMGLNKKYEMVWLITGNEEQYPKFDNVSYIQMFPKKFSERIKLLKLKATARCLICCNYYLISQRKGQFSIYITHGSPLKCCKDYYVLPKEVNKCVVQAENWIEPVAKQMAVDLDRIVALGYPRNDVLSQPDFDLKKIFNGEFKKIVAWYPTYRQHKSGKQTGSSNALPIVHDEKLAAELNDYAKEKGVLIIIKPHFAQDVSKIKSLNLSNIMLINDNFFIENKITSYQFIKSCDSMITDYSSVYYDYLLADKPVAVVWEDYDEYAKDPGFAVDTSFYLKAAEKIYNINDFKVYLDNLSSGKDLLAKERKEINELVNYSSDGKNAQRVAEYIIKEGNL